MYTLVGMRTRLEEVFESRQAQVLAQVITDAYSELVKTSDFNELKEIVGELAQAQKELAQAQRGPSSGWKNWRKRKRGPSSGWKNWRKRKRGPKNRSRA